MKPRLNPHNHKESNCQVCINYINKLEDHRQSIIDRFWSKVEKTSTCWIWVGLKDHDGYGSFTLNGSKCGSHKFSYESVKGKIPKGLVLDHLCRNRFCVNPEHLEIVTHQENVKRGLSGKINNYNKKKTHCPKGHELSGNNLLPYQLKLGGRSCRICANNRQLKYYYKKKDYNNGGDNKSKKLLRLSGTSSSNNTKRGKRKFDLPKPVLVGPLTLS